MDKHGDILTGKDFHSLYILSAISNCHTNIVCVLLLAVDWRYAMIHVMRSLIAKKRIICIMKMIIICKAEWKKMSIPEGSQLNRSFKVSVLLTSGLLRNSF